MTGRKTPSYLLTVDCIEQTPEEPVTDCTVFIEAE